jgi:hypothetical protein
VLLYVTLQVASQTTSQVASQATPQATSRLTQTRCESQPQRAACFSYDAYGSDVEAASR